eukprot:353059-Chlamydomonas_euryale.AAC.7
MPEGQVMLRSASQESNQVSGQASGLGGERGAEKGLHIDTCPEGPGLQNVAGRQSLGQLHRDWNGATTDTHLFLHRSCIARPAGTQQDQAPTPRPNPSLQIRPRRRVSGIGHTRQGDDSLAAHVALLLLGSALRALVDVPVLEGARRILAPRRQLGHVDARADDLRRVANPVVVQQVVLQSARAPGVIRRSHDALEAQVGNQGLAVLQLCARTACPVVRADLALVRRRRRAAHTRIAGIAGVLVQVEAVGAAPCLRHVGVGHAIDAGI